MRAYSIDLRTKKVESVRRVILQVQGCLKATKERKKSVDTESKSQALVGSLQRLTPEMKETLRIHKAAGTEGLEREDFVWHYLLQSFATMGSSRGWDGLIGNRANYERVTFEALAPLDSVERVEVADSVLRAAKVRYAAKKAVWLDLNHAIVAELGGMEGAKRQAFAQEGTEAKIAFMKLFHGIGDKYGRNIWMDVYHPDFRDTIAVDERIKRITEALGYSFKSYAGHERFYQDIAREAGLQGWELDRLLYNHRDAFLLCINNA
jgi:hypothetical protein